MKKFNILITTSVFALLVTGCVKPTQDTQSVYTNTTQPTNTAQPTNTTQPIVYEEAQPIVYEPSVGTTVYEEIQPDTTVITTGEIGQPVGAETSYPDPYANNAGGGTIYNDPYANQPAISDYPVSSSSVNTGVSSGQGGGIHLQIAALKDYRTAEDYKNRLSLAPGQTAYVQRGAMNKVIVTGISSISEVNRLKASRFPGAFIVQGAAYGSYTPSVQPNYDTSSGGGNYSINTPYASSSASSGGSGIGVQVGAFGSQGKAQSVANGKGSQYPAIVKKIGQYYKVILTGFSSRSAAKAHAGRVGGFVVNY